MKHVTLLMICAMIAPGLAFGGPVGGSTVGTVPGVVVEPHEIWDPVHLRDAEPLARFLEWERRGPEALLHTDAVDTVMAEALVGQTVHHMVTGEKIGRVEDVELDANGEVRQVALSVATGGGASEKLIVSGDKVTLGMHRATLERIAHIDIVLDEEERAFAPELAGR